MTPGHVECYTQSLRERKEAKEEQGGSVAHQSVVIPDRQERASRGVLVMLMCTQGPGRPASTDTAPQPDQ